MSDDLTHLTRQRPHEPFGPVKRKKFIEAYRQTSNVRASCEHANVSRETYYTTLKKDAEFKAAIEVAEQEAIDRLEAKAWNNALVRDSETSLWNLLKAHRPKKYKEPVQRVASTDSEGNDVSTDTDEQIIAKAAGIIARRETLSSGEGDL